MDDELVGKSAMRIKFPSITLFLRLWCQWRLCLPSFCLPFLDGIHEEKLKSTSHLVLIVDRHWTRQGRWIDWRLFKIKLWLCFIVCLFIYVHFCWLSMLSFSLSFIFDFLLFTTIFDVTFTFTTRIFFIH